MTNGVSSNACLFSSLLQILQFYIQYDIKPKEIEKQNKLRAIIF